MHCRYIVVMFAMNSLVLQWAHMHNDNNGSMIVSMDTDKDPLSMCKSDHTYNARYNFMMEVSIDTDINHIFSDAIINGLRQRQPP